MAAAAPAIMIASAAVGAVAHLSAAERFDESGEEARALAERNAALIEAESREEGRRLRFQAEKEQSLARARAAASGITMAGSPGLHLAEMEQVLGDELDWLRRSSESRQDIMRRTGGYQRDIAQARGMGARLGAVQSVLGGVHGVGESYNWWQR